MLVEPVMVEDETITLERLFNDVELPHPRARELVLVGMPDPNPAMSGCRIPKNQRRTVEAHRYTDSGFS